MVYSILKNVFFFSLLIATGYSCLEAHIFNVQKLVKGSHSVMLLSDFHSPLNAKKERDAIVQCAKACGGAIVVEDMSTSLAHDVTQQINGNLYQWPLSASKVDSLRANSSIIMLYSSAIHAGVAASNIEFRFNRSLRLKEIFKIIEEKIKRIKAADHGTIYNAYYNRSLNYLKNSFETPCAQLFQNLISSDIAFDAMLKSGLLSATDNDIAQANKIMADRGYNFPIQNPTDAIENLYNDYCNIVLEMEMIHSIAEYNNYKNVFVCAGSLHIAHISRVLQENGYVIVNEIGEPLPTTFDSAYFEKVDKTSFDLEQVLSKLSEEATSGTTASNIPGTGWIAKIFYLIIKPFTALFN